MTADLEQRVAKLEEAILRLAPLPDLLVEVKEKLAFVDPSSVTKNRSLTKEMEKEHYLTWGKLHTDPEFAGMFRDAHDFYFHADKMAKAWGWKIETIERRRYYYDDDSIIEAIRKNAEWHRYESNDRELSKLLVHKVIEPAGGPVNILDHLRSVYPDRGDKWLNEVEDFLELYIKQWNYSIDRSDQNPDVFSKTGRVQE
jgi:hypothetical protein